MPRRRVVRNLVCYALAAAVLGLWLRSGRRADVVGVFTPAGSLQALGSHRGTIYLFLSDVPFREARRMSVDVDSTDADTFDLILSVLDRSMSKRRALGRFAAGVGEPGALGSPGTTFLLLQFPHWLLLLIAM